MKSSYSFVFLALCASMGKSMGEHEFTDKIKDVVHHVTEETKAAVDDVATKFKMNVPKIQKVMDEAEQVVDDIVDKVEHTVNCPSVCALDYRPVCASDGNTYPNLCAMKRGACMKGIELSVISEGKCQESEEKQDDNSAGNFKEHDNTACLKPCPRDYHPVCGTDGKTYANSCILEVTACKSNVDINVAHQGKCTAPPKNVDRVSVPNSSSKNSEKDCMKPCPRILAPVCTTTGVTFPNKCVMEVSGCELDVEFIKAHDGQCEEKADDRGNPCRQVCPKLLAPVCASNGQSYVNTCELEKAACEENESLTVVHEGYCCDSISCSDDLNPVCGSDGVRYPNLCHLQIASCESPSKLRPVSDSNCHDTKSFDSVDDDKQGTHVLLGSLIAGLVVLAVVLFALAFVMITRGGKATTQLDYSKLFENEEAPPPYEFENEILTGTPQSLKNDGKEYIPVSTTNNPSI
eukprot:CFRG3042T1